MTHGTSTTNRPSEKLESDPISPRRGKRCGERGQSLAEIAVILPLLLLLLLGIIEIGRYAALSVLVANAARAGVQYGAQNLATAGNTSGIQTAALNDGQNVSGLSVTSVNILCGCSGSTPGSTCPVTCTAPSHELVYVQVNTKGNFTALFNFPGIPSPIIVNESAQMRVAQ